MNSDNQFTT